ncbi:hypothetical protein Vadar_001914 [Vaccinium darrowii]|uniref:Uncharacterized protein n=1 Tax=Vaccinium darrowii TaxID=229202 RepID=A0ACB7YBP8_9ERIC|nr:hypothetical protein Vadar_001914 [Vaccinium darrowii]
MWRLFTTTTNTTSPSPTVVAVVNRASSVVSPSVSSSTTAQSPLPQLVYPSLAIATRSADNNNQQLAVATTVNPPTKRSTKDRHTKVDGRWRRITVGDVRCR